MEANSVPPHGASVVHQRTDELLMKEETVSVKEGAKHAQSLICLSSHLVHVTCRPGQLRIKCHPTALSTHCIVSGLVWALVASRCFRKVHRYALCDIDRNPPVP
jgi:hypothetical protein